MAKHKHYDDDDDNGDGDYKKSLYELQIELVKLQRQLIAKSERVLVIIEGRDGAGKDGTIKRLIAHMSPRETRVFAPSKPSDREESEWYFQRFVPYLPAGGEFVVFNRSWYNRAGVEQVMGFATPAQIEQFYDSVGPFEEMLVRAGIHLRKYYLDISRKEQKKRLADRAKDPLKNWKISPIDAAAQKKWDDYSKARDEMLDRTSHAMAPWSVVKADVKKIARLEFLRDLLASFDYKGQDKKLVRPEPKIVFSWSQGAEDANQLAH